MNIEAILAAVQMIVGLIAAGAVPWALMMERRLGRIEASIKAVTDNHSRQIEDLRTTVAKIEDRVHDLEKGQ